jgi:hypothetical protein
MQRWTSVAFGLLFVAAIVGLVVTGRTPEPTLASAAPSASVSAPLPSADPVAVDAAVPTEPSPDSAASSAFSKLPDGGDVPALPNNAPKAVTLGVVLFQYRGAQAAARDAPSRERALEKARELLPLAQKDFDEAVKRGDPGSLGNAGTLPQGVLEPAVEYTVFTLQPGELYPEPLDTPRGFWIVRRLK